MHKNFLHVLCIWWVFRHGSIAIRAPKWLCNWVGVEDENNELYEKFFLQMVVVVFDEFETKPHLRAKGDGSIVDRECLYYDIEVNHEM